jgi:hypothetical protein
MFRSSKELAAKVLARTVPTVALIVVAASHSARASNLVANGNFSVDAPSSGCVAGTTTLADWTVEGNIDIGSVAPGCAPALAAAPGATYFVDLTGSYAEEGQNDVGTISQTISTVAGQKYNLSFYFGGNPQWQSSPYTYPNDGPLKSMNVLLNGSVFGNFSVNTAGVSITNGQWALETLSFTATSNSTQIGFQSLDGISPNLSDYGPLLDDVQLTPVPLPDSAWQLISGLIGSGLIMRGGRRNYLPHGPE